MEKAELDAATQPVGPETPPAKREKVAILGFVQHFKLAPFDDPSFEIWGLNELYQMIPRWDRWFELHDRRIYENDRNRTSEHVEKLKAMTCPVYMHRHWDDIPQSVEYPLQEIAAMFPNPCPEAKPYFTNSISYMILLAVAEGFKELHVYGVDMAHSCLAPQTRVLRDDLQWVPVGDVKVGDTLVGFDEHVPPGAKRHYRKAVVEAAQELVRPSYRLWLADGTTMIASEDHKWLVPTKGGRWLTTKQLVAQNDPKRGASHLMKLMPTWHTDRPWQGGYLAAAYDGEGHLYQDVRDRPNTGPMALRFTQRPNGMSAMVEEALQTRGYAYARGTHSHKDAWDYSIRGGRTEIMRFLGSVRPRRLLDKYSTDLVGKLHVLEQVPLTRKESVGEQLVIGLRTSTRTFIAEGFASHNSEYGQQRPSCEWAIGIAQGRGIQVYLPSESDLLKTLFLYGYEQDAAVAFDRKLAQREQEFTQHMANLDKQIAELTEVRAQYRGAHQDAVHIRTNWKSLHEASSG